MSTNKNNRVSIICYRNSFLVYHQHKHNARHLSTNSFSSRPSHNPHSRFVRKDSAREEHGLLDWLHIHTLSTPSHSQGTSPHHSHAANHSAHILIALKDPEDQYHPTHRPYSPNCVLATVDTAAYLTSSPCCRGTGCSPMSTAGGGSSNIYGSGELCIHSDMQEISNEARITNMRDKAII